MLDVRHRDRHLLSLLQRDAEIPVTVLAWRVSLSVSAWSDIPESVEVHRLTGHFDDVLKIVLPDVEHYDKVYKALVGRVELFDVSASISTETPKDDTAVPTGFA